MNDQKLVVFAVLHKVSGILAYVTPHRSTCSSPLPVVSVRVPSSLLPGAKLGSLPIPVMRNRPLTVSSSSSERRSLAVETLLSLIHPMLVINSLIFLF